MITKVYVINTFSGALESIQTGELSSIELDLKDTQNYTLVAPPSLQAGWTWNGLEWVKDDINKETQLE